MSVAGSRRYPEFSLTDNQLDDILHRLDEGVVGIDGQGNCTFANAKALQLLGVSSSADLIGQSMRDTLHCHIQDEAVNSDNPSSLLPDVTAAGPLKNQLKKHNGEWLEVLYWHYPLLDDGQPKGAVIGFRENLQPANEQLEKQANIGLDRYQLLIESTQVVLWEYDISSEHFTFVSPQAEKIFGYPLSEWYSKDFWENKIHPLDRERAIADCKECALLHNDYELEYRMLKADGDLIYVRDYISVVWRNGAPHSLRGIFTDITEQKAQEDGLRLSAIVFEGADAVVITNAHAQILRVNKSFTAITGYSESEVIGKNPSILSSKRQSADFYKDLWADLKNHQHWQGEIWNKRKSGEIYPEWLTITAVQDDDGDVCNYIGVFSDISHEKSAEEKIRFKDSHDALTHLPNRALLYSQLKKSIEKSKKNRFFGALLFLDLDEFKLINDTMGHKYGDELLKKVASRVSGHISGGDFLARIGGDEFAILMPAVGLDRQWVEECTEKFAEEIRQCLLEIFEIDEKKFHISSSIGVSIFPGIDGSANTGASDALRQADTAMFRAKDSGKNQVRLFTPDMHLEIERRLIIHNELSTAISNNELEIYLQPQYDINGNPVAAEALLRWFHPLHGAISPAEFIPVAEKTGLIVPLGNWVVAQICQLVGIWKNKPGFYLQRIAVNVSSQQFDDTSFFEFIEAQLKNNNIDGRLIELELTEEVLVGDMDQMSDLFYRLKSLGVHFSIDDFGTGYSSLRYLKRLPLDNLKIDQSFVQDIPHDGNDCILVDTIVAMAQHMGLSVTAEGVETKEQKEFLTGLGCDLFQGYLFSRPMSIKQFETKYVNNKKVSI